MLCGRPAMVARCGGDRAEAPRDVVAVAGEDNNVVAGEMQLCAPAVELHLMDPLVADWRRLGEYGGRTGR